MSNIIDITYSYKDVPTIKRFSQSNKRIRAIMGPIGSGKSTGCVMEIIRRAKMQKPSPSGIRYSRYLVVRNTYPELKDTTIRTFHDWLPPRYFGKWNQTDHNYLINRIFLPDGTKVECEVMFRALDRPEHVSHLLSLELTGAWMNEVREIPKPIFDAIDTRINRYPSGRQGGVTWTGIFMDTNPPDTDHWFYKYFEETRPDNSEIFKQPSGVSKYAENIPPDGSHLPVDYYTNLMQGKDPEFIKVYVHGEYGFVMDGMPVYGNYVDSMHTADKVLTPVPGLSLILGWDFGVGNPACVVTQLHPNGKFRAIREFIAPDMGIRTFAREIVKPELATTYKGYDIQSVGDPAGTRRADTDERTCYQELHDAGIPTIPARSNAFQSRYEAVNAFLMKQVAGKPALEVSPACKMLRKGFNGGYKYRRIQVVGDERYHNVPEKNIYSHIHDAFQYAALFLDSSIKMNTNQAYGQSHSRTDIITPFAWT
jgi:hypothetical protein